VSPLRRINIPGPISPNHPRKIMISVIILPEDGKIVSMRCENSGQLYEGFENHGKNPKDSTPWFNRIAIIAKAFNPSTQSRLVFPVLLIIFSQNKRFF